MDNTLDKRDRAAADTPWWRIRMMWLVIGGPLVVVVAAFVTLAAALRHPDPVLSTAPVAGSTADTPAVQARNHAATPQR
ncbi:MAG: hypothetical protein IPM15_05210 [Betaproteobacteria bacterium]|nr:hypothetical protein [Betaproteobacteria bacterium]MCC6249679.1 hypothetical protein [Rubrivivax sp.]MCL4698082.1 hypothetical protein [Burkholderiaceae bacterium]